MMPNKVVRCLIATHHTRATRAAIALSKAFANHPQVQQFIPLEGVSDCPQDEAPALVNAIFQARIAERSH